MTNKKSTKRALLSSILAMVLCCSMLIGTTFAWFTDSVTSKGNIIKTGTLNVEMYWSEGKDAPTDDAWKDASKGAIFNNTLWEPGYTEARHLKIANEGSLALKYQLAIIPNGDVSELADVIDVYYQSPAKQISADRQNLGTKVGTLADVIRTGIRDGALAAKTAYTATIVLKMQESAGNEYQDKSIGTSFSIQLIATQMASENDSFGPDYDENAWAEGMVVHTEADLKAALENGNNVALAADITLTAPLEIAADSTKVLNLNGKKLSGATTKDEGALLVNNGTLTLVGGTMTNTTLNGAAVINNNGTLTLKNVTVQGAPIDATGYPEYAVTTYGKLTVENGTTVLSDRGALRTYAGAELVVNGGEFVVSNAAAGRNMTLHTVYATGSGATVTINGGKFVQNHVSTGGASVICPAGATINVYGGEFSDPMDESSWQNTANFQNYMGYSAPVNVYGGTYTDNSVMKWVADGYQAVKNMNGTYSVVSGDVLANDNAALNDALANGEDNIALGAGNFEMPGTNGDVTISGTKDTVITVTTPTANKVTLNGVTVVAGSYKGIQHSDTVVFENCLLKGSQFLYANKVIIKNCVIDLTETADYIWTYSAKNVEFIDCTFNTLGKAILMYNEGPDLVTNVTVKGCTFNATESALASGAVAAAIEIASSAAVNGHYTLTTENNVVDPDFSGEWRIKNSATNNTTVNGVIYNKVEDGLYKGESNTFYVYNANGLEAINKKMADKTAGRDAVVNLLADIDFTGKVWTPVDSHADTAFEIAEINGNGHTISNLTINGQAMFRRFAGTGDVVIKDITFDNANVNSNGQINTALIVGHTYQNLLLDNVDVKNSTITGGYKVAPLIATVYNESTSSITATLKNCDVENVTVKATSYDFCTTGMVAFVYADDNDKIVFENCSVTNVDITAPNVYTAHAAVYTTGSETLFDEVEGVTVTNVTFETLA